MKSVVVFLLAISTYTYGQRPADFTLTNVADDHPVTLSSYSSPVVLIFTSHECAFDNYYPGRIKSLIDTYSGKIQFLIINAGVEPSESVDHMKEKYHVWGYPVPYLADKDQVTLDMFGARKTPEAFLLKKTGDHYVVVYHGPIDDNPQVAADVREHFLRENIDWLLGGKTENREVRPGGCTIRRK